MSLLDEFLELDSDGLFYPGHASALVRMNDKLFLFDPIWDEKPYGQYWTFFPKQTNCDRIVGDAYACFISHIHADHVSVKVLERLNCPVDVMKGRPLLNERITKITGHGPMEWTPLVWHELKQAGVEFMFVPHAFNTVDSSVFIRNKKTGYCVYVGSDNFLDEAMLKKLKPLVERIDVACVPWAFVHWYPDCMSNMSNDEKQDEKERLQYQSLKQYRNFIQRFCPAHEVPFGANLFYAESMNHPLNNLGVSPLLTSEDVASGGYVTASGLVVNNDTESMPRAKPQPPMDFKFEITPVMLCAIQKRVARATVRLRGQKIIVNDVVIDLFNHTTTFWPNEVDPPYTRFNFDSAIFSIWVSGIITFEQAIGTRRFECERMPNVYNLEVFEWMNRWL